MAEEEDTETPRHILMKFLSGPAPVSQTPFPPFVQPKKQKEDIKTYSRRKSSMNTPRTLLKEVLKEKVNRNSSVLHTDQLSEKDLLGSHLSIKEPLSNVLPSDSSDIELSGEEMVFNSPRSSRKRLPKLTDGKRKTIPRRESLERELKFTESESSDANIQPANISKAKHFSSKSLPRASSSSVSSVGSTARESAVQSQITQASKMRQSDKSKLYMPSDSGATDDEASTVEDEQKPQRKSLVQLIGSSPAAQKLDLNVTFQKETPTQGSSKSDVKSKDCHTHKSPFRLSAIVSPQDTVSSTKRIQSVRAPSKSTEKLLQLPRLEDLRRQSLGSVVGNSTGGSFKSLSSMTDEDSEYEGKEEELVEPNVIPERSRNVAPKSKDMQQPEKSSWTPSKSVKPSTLGKVDAVRREMSAAKSPLSSSLGRLENSIRDVLLENTARSRSHSKRRMSMAYELTDSEDDSNQDVYAHSKSRNRGSRNVPSASLHDKSSAGQRSDKKEPSGSVPRPKRSRLSKAEVSFVRHGEERETSFKEHHDSVHETSRRSVQKEGNDEYEDDTAPGHFSLHVNKSKSEGAAESSTRDDMTPRRRNVLQHKGSVPRFTTRSPSKHSLGFDPENETTELKENDAYRPLRSAERKSSRRSKHLELVKDYIKAESGRSANVRTSKSHGSANSQTPSVSASSSSQARGLHELSETTQPYDEDEGDQVSNPNELVHPSRRKSFRPIQYVPEDIDQDTEPVPEDEEGGPNVTHTQVSEQIPSGRSLRSSSRKTKQTTIDAYASPAIQDVGSDESIGSELLPLAERVSRRLTAAKSLAVEGTKESVNESRERSSSRGRASIGPEHVSHSRHHSRQEAGTLTRTPTKSLPDHGTSRKRTPQSGPPSKTRKTVNEEIQLHGKSQTSARDLSVDASKKRRSKLHSSPIPKEHSKSQSIMSLGISPIRETEARSPDNEMEVSMRSKSLTSTRKSRLKDKSAKKRPIDNTSKKSKSALRSRSRLSPQPGPSGWLPEQTSARKSISVSTPPKQKAKMKRAFRAERPSLPVSLARDIIQHYSGFPVLPSAEPVLEECIDAFWDKTMSTLSAYANHANRNTIEKSDVQLYLHRLGLAKDVNSMNALIEKLLPFEMRCEVLPMAIAGNKVIP